MSDRPRPLIIYRDSLLPPSETFVRDQPESFLGFSPHYVGSRLVSPRIELPAKRTFVLNDGSKRGRMAEILFKSLGRSPALTRAIQQIAPALIHAHFGPDGALILPLARRLGIPLVCTFHGYDATQRDAFDEPASRTWRIYLRRRRELAGEVTLVLAASRYVASALEDKGFSPEKMVVHYIGVDTQLFSPAPLERLDKVLFVGRLEEVKGCRYLIDAMRYVQQDVDAELVVVGDGSLRRRLEDQASRELRSVSFLGNQPPSEVRRLMNQAKVFCVPSVTSSTGSTEGLGLVFAEAQSMGTPVVSFRSGGIPEVINHGETGFLVEANKSEELSKRIIALLKDASLWTRFSHAGRERMRKDFDLKTQSKKLEKLYEERVLVRG